MSKGYWIVSVTITDREPYEKYVAANAAVFAKWGGRFIVRGGAFDVMDGSTGERQVVLEFDSYQRARDCFNSPEYQQILKLLRAGAATSQFVIADGVEV